MHIDVLFIIGMYLPHSKICQYFSLSQLTLQLQCISFWRQRAFHENLITPLEPVWKTYNIAEYRYYSLYYAGIPYNVYNSLQHACHTHYLKRAGRERDEDLISYAISINGGKYDHFFFEGYTESLDGDDNNFEYLDTLLTFFPQDDKLRQIRIGGVVENAILLGKFNIAKKIIQKYSLDCSHPRNLMRVACMVGDLPFIQYLYTQQGMQGKFDMDVFSYTAVQGHIHVVEYLLECGADDIYGLGLVSVAKNGHSDILRLLLKANTMLPQYRKPSYRKALTDAFTAENTEIVEILSKIDLES